MSALDYTVEVEPGGTFVIVKVRGEITTQGAILFDVASHSFGRERGLDRFLVDVTEATHVASAADTYFFVYKEMPTTTQLSRSARVALLVRPGDHSHDFVVLTCKNSGLNITLFDDRQLAERHLRRESSGRQAS